MTGAVHGLERIMSAGLVTPMDTRRRRSAGAGEGGPINLVSSLGLRTTSVRSTSAWQLSQAGLREKAAESPPDYYPAFDWFGGLEFLRSEKESTNQAYANKLAGASVGVLGSGGSYPTGWDYGAGSGWITHEVVEIGVDDEGSQRIRIKLNGTNGGGTSYPTIFWHVAEADVASSGDDWTTSLRFKHISGTRTGSCEADLSEMTSGGSYLTGSSQSVGDTGSWEDIELTRTLTNGSTARVRTGLVLATDNGEGFSNYVFDLVVNNLEKREGASSRIETDNGPVLRGADKLRVATPASIASLSEFTFISRLRTLVDDGNRKGFGIGAGLTDRVNFDVHGAGDLWLYMNAGGSIISRTRLGSTVSPGVDQLVGLRVKAGDYGVWQNGTKVLTETWGSLPDFSTGYLSLGCFHVDGSQSHDLWFGTNDTVIYPTGLSDAEIAALTTL